VRFARGLVIREYHNPSDVSHQEQIDRPNPLCKLARETDHR
jgi:hypothetical protein